MWCATRNAHVKKATRIISCCCALHNFLISRGESVLECVLYQSGKNVNYEANEVADDWFSLGIRKRNELIDLLYTNFEGED